jgi:transposase
VKTIRSQKLRMLLTHRKPVEGESQSRGTLRNFGLKVGMVGKVKFEARIRELVENLPDLAMLVEPMLIVRRTLREQIVILGAMPSRAIPDTQNSVDPNSDHFFECNML